MTISTAKCKIFNLACETLEKHSIFIRLTIIIEIVLPISIFANGNSMSKLAILAPSVSKGRSSNSLTKEQLVILLELREIGCRSVSQSRKKLVLGQTITYTVHGWQHTDDRLFSASCLFKFSEEISDTVFTAYGGFCVILVHLLKFGLVFHDVFHCRCIDPLHMTSQQWWCR